eukprot:51280_1
MNNKQLKRSQSECIQPRCATFTSKGVQSKYTIDEWYHKQIHEHINTYPNITPKELYAWVQHTDYFSYTAIEKKFKTFQKGITPSKKLRKLPKRIDGISKKIAQILFQYEYKNINDICRVLNSFSNQKGCPKILTEYPLGICLKGAIEMKTSVSVIGTDTDYQSLMIKQIVASSVISVDKDKINYKTDLNLKEHKIINKDIIKKFTDATLARKILPSDCTTSMIEQCIVNKYKLIARKARTLWNKLTCLSRP